MQLVKPNSKLPMGLNNVYHPPSYFCEPPPVAPIVVFPVNLPPEPVPTAPSTLTSHASF